MVYVLISVGMLGFGALLFHTIGKLTTLGNKMVDVEGSVIYLKKQEAYIQAGFDVLYKTIGTKRVDAVVKRIKKEQEKANKKNESKKVRP